MQLLRLFCDVARYQSFSRAAEEHGVTQSAASQRISALEKDLGVTLIDRSVRPLGLTPAGELYYKEASSIVRRYENLVQKIAHLQKQPSGHVHVDAIYSAGIDLLNHVHAAFVKQYPRVAVSIEYKQPEEVHDAVRAGRCDLGIVSYPKSWRDIGVMPLRDEAMAVVCSPRHPLAGRERLEARELADWSMITLESDLPVGRHIRKYLKEHGELPTITASFDNVDTVKTALQVSDDQFSILPRRTVLRELAAGTLAAVALMPAVARPMGLIYPRGRRDFSPALQVFVDFLLEHAGPDADTIDEADTRGRHLVGDRL